MTNEFTNGAARAAEKARQVAAAGLEAADGLAETAGRLAESAAEYVRTNPARSLLCALGAGFVVGWIWKNR